MIRQIPVYRGSEHVGTYAEDDPEFVVWKRTVFSRKQAKPVYGANGHVFILLDEGAPILASEKPDKALTLRRMNTKYTFLEELGKVSTVTGVFEATSKCHSFKDIDYHPRRWYRQVEFDCIVGHPLSKAQLDCMVTA